VTSETERRATRRQPRESRHRAREAALQMLYQWEVGRISMFEVRQTFWAQAEAEQASPDLSAVAHCAKADDLRAFATALADGVAAQVEQIDPTIATAAEHWRLERMNVMDRLILRLATYEFLYTPDTPGKVIINEALELARTFSGDESVRFINGILDGIRRTLERE
jgi:transcription antitermination protein NusB